ncbi:hypothetical protein DOA20_26150 [Salmonella enterica subsp. enterica serovar Newport]|nr:hypothetical protein [Salmonella enterica subsp. enterica serovar Newport]
MPLPVDTVEKCKPIVDYELWKKCYHDSENAITEVKNKYWQLAGSEYKVCTFGTSYEFCDFEDPNYASYRDYQNGITRCDRNPNDSSCHPHNSGGSGNTGGSGSDDSHTVIIPPPGQPGGQPGNKPDDKPDNKPGGDTGNKPGGNPGGPPGSGDSGGNNHNGDGNSGGDSGNNSGSGNNPVLPGTGGGNSDQDDSKDNGDILNELKAFHRDNNSNYKDLKDSLNKKPGDADYSGMEGQFSEQVGGAMSGVTDAVKSAWDAGKAAFGEGLGAIDGMLPDIRTSFDLPPGFAAASTGRCIPVVLDFTIQLVGIPDYHFHAVGTQVCLLYDEYIRPVLNFCMVILSFFVIHRLLVRSAEFLTDGRH